MQLIYRANAYTYVPAAQRDIQPRAINWRYRGCEGIATDVTAVPVLKAAHPRAINWRYQLAAI
ncbi:MAG: hypothetical protein HC866_16230 [Leptolyngbyaceae cyanobacterium RU_5_1]|nr:hypothetical protein [Leptolyngbyaceae cyanobacterium RU_5_1]